MSVIDTISGWLSGFGLGNDITTPLAWIVLGLGITLIAWLANWIAKRVLLKAINFIVKRSKTTWDDVLVKRNVFTRASHLAPAMVLYGAASMFGEYSGIIQRISLVYIALAGLLVINAFLNAAGDIYGTFAISKHKPIKGYLQVLKIIITVLLGIVAIAILLEQSPLVLLSGIGAMTAVLMLVFKDSILGLVASIQLSTNDMIRIGDWIEVPQFGADGDVIDITLHNVMVQNWDKTITSIPAYALISGSFKNWRGMSESGGRRIKRSIVIDMESIAFCDESMLARFSQFQLLSDYIDSRSKEIQKYNQSNNVDRSELVNGRNLTNVGCFRAYLKAYLDNHPKIHKGMTFLVRQLKPGEHGLPIELYVFSNDQEWISYEEIQADIFDHLLASLSFFELRVFQSPSGASIERATKIRT